MELAFVDTSAFYALANRDDRHHAAAKKIAAGLEELYLSLDGPPPVHDRIRGREGAFDRAVAGVEALLGLDGGEGLLGHAGVVLQYQLPHGLARVEIAHQPGKTHHGTGPARSRPGSHAQY